MKLLATIALLAASQVAQAKTITPFELQWMNHENRTTTYKSSEPTGKVHIIETYFLNCPYCNDNAPNVDEMAEHYANEPRVQVLDVGRDCREVDYDTWIEKHNPNHPVLNDCKQVVIKQLNAGNPKPKYPTVFVTDCKGTVHFERIGVWSPSTKSSIRAAVTKALQVDCTPEEM